MLFFPTDKISFWKKPGPWLAGSILFLLAGCHGSLHFDSKEERLDAGMEAIRSFDFHQANRILDGISNQYEFGTKSWMRAAYLEATAARHVRPVTRRNLERTTRLFREIIEAEGEPYSRLALMDLARMQALSSLEGDMDPESTRSMYRQIIEQWPDSREADVATMWLSNSFLHGPNPREGAKDAANALRDRLAEYPDTEMSPLLWQALANVYRTIIRDHENALNYLLEVDQRGFPKADRLDEFLFSIARTAERVGQPALAAEFYARIIEETPRSRMGWHSQQRIIHLNEENPHLNARVPALGEALEVEES